MAEKKKNEWAEKLAYAPKNGYERLSAEEEQAMHAYCEDYKDFLDHGKTERLCVEHCIELARKNGVGEKIHFGLGYFLIGIGRSTGGKDSEWLKGSFRRLSASVVEITDGKKTYWGSMIYRGVRDEETGKHVIEVNPDIVKLYGTDGWTAIERAVRTALKGQPLAQWLHGFYASHARPYPMKVETLHKLCGSQAKRLADYRTDLRSALQKLAEATGWTWEIDDADLVHIAKLIQARHITKKSA